MFQGGKGSNLFLVVDENDIDEDRFIIVVNTMMILTCLFKYENYNS